MPDALILDVPVEQGLPFMSPIGTDRVDAEGEMLPDVVNEIDRIGLSVTPIDSQSTNTRSIVDGRVLIAYDFPAPSIAEDQELHVYLDMMSRHLFLIATIAWDGSVSLVLWEPIETMATQDAIDTLASDLDAMIAGEVPGDPLGAKLITAPQVQDLLFNLRGCATR